MVSSVSGQDEPNPELLLATQGGYIAWLGLPAVSGLRTSATSCSILKHAKKELGQYPANFKRRLVNNPCLVTSACINITACIHDTELLSLISMSLNIT